MQLTDLALLPDLLYLFVFGPGFGESIVVRVPPDEWLVVDSLRHQTRLQDINPALRLLAAHDAAPAAVALTHPHHDHVHGFDQLLDIRRPGGPVGRTDVFSAPEEDWRRGQDASLMLDTGTTASVLNRIDHNLAYRSTQQMVADAGRDAHPWRRDHRSAVASCRQSTQEGRSQPSFERDAGEVG